MKFEFTENKWHTHIAFIPETPAETAQLMRFAKSSKKETPSITFSFSTNEPECRINIQKIKDTKQNNYIANK